MHQEMQGAKGYVSVPATVKAPERSRGPIR